MDKRNRLVFLVAEVSHLVGAVAEEQALFRLSEQRGFPCVSHGYTKSD